MRDGKTHISSPRPAGQAAVILALLTPVAAAAGPPPPRQMERLDRGLVAVPALGGGVLDSWRRPGTGPAAIGSNLYRGGVRLTPRPITGATNLVDPTGGPGAVHSVRAVIGGREQLADRPAAAWPGGSLTIALQWPAGGVAPSPGGTSPIISRTLASSSATA